VVRDAWNLGPFYLPPLLMGVAALIMAGVAATRVRWATAAAAAFAAILLVGSFTVGWQAVSYRITHPGAVMGFAEDTLQLAGEAIAVAAGVAAVVQRRRSPGGRRRQQISAQDHRPRGRMMICEFCRSFGPLGILGSYWVVGVAPGIGRRGVSGWSRPVCAMSRAQESIAVWTLDRGQGLRPELQACLA
jgi:hypothetical protein